MTDHRHVLAPRIRLPRTQVRFAEPKWLDQSESTVLAHPHDVARRSYRASRNGLGQQASVRRVPVEDRELPRHASPCATTSRSEQ